MPRDWPGPAAIYEKIGVEIVRKALEEPLRMIAQNAGMEGSIVLAKVKESKDKNFGYNAQTTCTKTSPRQA